MPRPYVAARSRVPESSMARSDTITLGSPSLKVPHVVPPLVVRKTPASVPTYSVLGDEGSSSIALAGMSGRFEVMLVHVHVTPPSLLTPRYTCTGRVGVLALNPLYEM